MRSRAPLLIVLVALLILGLLVFIGVLTRIRQISVLLPSVVQNELQLRLGRDVHLGTARLVGPNTAVITDLSISEKPSFGKGTFFYAKRAIITYNTSGFLFRVIPSINGITSVTLVEPRLRIVRNKQGAFNVSDILRRPAVPPTARFRGIVRVQQGMLTVVDYTAETTKIPAVNALNALSGALDFRPVHTIAIALAGRGAAGRIGGFRAVGRWGLDKPVTSLTLAVTNANAPYWLDYFTSIRTWSLAQGTLDGRVVLTQPSLGGALLIHGTGDLRNASITSSYLTIPIKPVAATVSFVGSNISLVGSGRLGGSPVDVRGRIASRAPAHVDLQVTSQRMNLGVLQHAIRALPALPVTWGQPGTVSARITGPTSNPVVMAAITASSATISSTPVTSLEVTGSYRNHAISVTRASAIAAGGRVTASANIGLRPFTVTGAGTATNLNLASFSKTLGTPVSGKANADFVFNYKSGIPTARAQIRVVSGRVGGISIRSGQGILALVSPGVVNGEVTLTGGTVTRDLTFTNAVARFSVRQRTVTVSNAVVALDGGRITAHGTATLGGPLNVSLDARGVDVHPLLTALGYEQVTGIASLTGSLTGTTSSPVFNGSISAQNGHIANVAYDSLAGRVTASPEQVVLRDISVRSPSGRIATTGDVTLSSGVAPSFNVTLVADRVDLSSISMLGQLKTPLRGIASADISIQGRPPDLRVTGQAAVANAIIDGISVDSASIRLVVSGQQTVISELIVRQGAMQLVGSGSVGPQGLLSLDVRGENLDLSLAKKALLPYIALTGPADLAGHVGGTLTSPTLNAQLTARGPTVNGQHFDLLTSHLFYNGVEVTLSNTELSSGPVNYQVSLARYIMATKSLEVNAAVTSVAIPALLAILQGSPAYTGDAGSPVRDIVESIPQPVTGMLNASLGLVTSFAQQNALPTASLSLSVIGLSLAGTQFGDLTAAARLSNTGVTLENVALTGPLGQVSMQGGINPEGALSLAGSGKDISPAIVHPWLPKEPTTGQVNFTFMATGTLDEPQITASVQATNIARGEFSVNSISVDKVTITGDRIAVDQLVVQKESSTLVISGYVPFSLATISIPSDQSLSVSVHLTDPDFVTAQYLPSFVQESHGSLTADATVTGTMANPVGSGDIALQNGFVKLRHFDNSFIHLAASGRFQGSQLIVDTAMGESSLGGSFNGGGQISFGGPSDRAVSLFLSLNALKLSETNITESQGEHVSMTATGRLEAVGTIESPVVQGQIVVSDAGIVVPAKAVATTVTVPPLPISSQLAVTVNLARNVTVRRGSLFAEIVGPITIAGTSTSPIISGTVQITRGRLSYPGRTFELVPGGTASLLLRPPQPAVLSVNVTAATSITVGSTFTGALTRYRVFLDIFGPVGDLDISVRSIPPGLSDIEALAGLFGGAALESIIVGEPAQNQFQEQLGQLLLGFVIPGLLPPVEIGGLTFEVVPGVYSPLALTVTAFVSDKVSLFSAESVAGGVPIIDFGVNYSLTPQFSSILQFESQPGVIVDVTVLVQYYKRY